MKKGYKESRKRGIINGQYKRRRVKWISYILRRNCILKHVIEGKIEGRIEVTGKQGRRNKQLLEELNLYSPNDIYIYIYIYIYMSYRTANLQMLHFIYLFNKYTY